MNKRIYNCFQPIDSALFLFVENKNVPKRNENRSLPEIICSILNDSVSVRHI